MTILLPSPDPPIPPFVVDGSKGIMPSCCTPGELVASMLVIISWVDKVRGQMLEGAGYVSAIYDLPL